MGINKDYTATKLSRDLSCFFAIRCHHQCVREQWKWLWHSASYARCPGAPYIVSCSVAISAYNDGGKLQLGLPSDEGQTGVFDFCTVVLPSDEGQTGFLVHIKI